MKSKVETSIANSSTNEFFKILLNGAVNIGFNKAQSVFRFEDDIFYKQVYFGNLRVGTAYFGTFTVDNDFVNAIEQVRLRNEGRKNGVNHSAKSLLRHREEVHEVGGDLATVNHQLENAYAELDKLKKFHFLRNNTEKTQQISQQEQYILQLEQEKRKLEAN